MVSFILLTRRIMKKSWLWILLLLILAFALYGVSGTLNKAKDIAGWAIDVVGDAAEGAADLAWDAVDVVGDAAEWAADLAWDAIDAVGDVAWDTVDAVEWAADAVVEWTVKIVDEVEDAIDEVADEAADLVDGDTDVEVAKEELGEEIAEEAEETQEATDEAEKGPTVWIYKDYNSIEVANAVASGRDVALFFHADRCPSCVALDGVIKDDIWELSPNLVVFKTDFDNQELSDQYGVTKQHTLVPLDSSGAVKERKLWIVTINQLNRLF